MRRELTRYQIRRWPGDTDMLLHAMPSAVLVVDRKLRLTFANPAAEQLLSVSWNVLAGRYLHDMVAPHATLLDLVQQVQARGTSISEYGVELALARGEVVTVDSHLSPVPEVEGAVLVVLHPCSVARRFDLRVSGRRATRSVAGLAATLAHEVKNPLSGIRGAAQLLEGATAEEDRSLIRLICDETDRICVLLDRMEAFGHTAPIEPRSVNIHQVLEHVRRLAGAGFARHLRLVERYDPSLPEVEGDRDLLVQIFLNLVKNAAEAAPADGGQITFVTQYQHGLRMTLGNSRERVELPITVEIRDNGSGVPDDLVEHLFEPFVTTKRHGTGLGLSLVAKMVHDHRGVVSYVPGEPGSVFRVRLPAARRMQDAGEMRDVA